ncbi:MAG: hypothetical protein ABIG44_06970 [Planctomycetota bacterium]
MVLADLTPAERGVVWECLRAAAHGPFFPDCEFQTIFGLERSEVAAIADDAPNIDDTIEDVSLAINNSMNNLLGYPHRQEQVWAEWISVSGDEVARIFVKWRGNRPENYFDGLR